MQVLQYKIRWNEKGVVRHKDFDAICKQCDIENSAAALERLDAAGVVVQTEDCVFLRPGLLVQMAGDATFSRWRPAASAEARLKKLIAAREPYEVQIRSAVNEAARHRKFVWASAFAYAGLQLAVIARLTYFDLDWDIMEPISYFLGVFTSLGFYLYMLRAKKEHNYSDYDARLASQGTVKVLRRKGFNFEEYRKLVEEIEATEAEIKDVEAWHASQLWGP